MSKKRIVIAVLILVWSSFFISSAVAAEGRHWVDEEMAEFKQHLLQYKNTTQKEEWVSVHSTVLSQAKLNEPIQIWNWAILLKMILDPDHGKSGPMLDMYVYGLSADDKITREDAIGGLVKLLTLNYIKGSVTARELEKSLMLADLEIISDRQRVLVQMAYCQGILDTQTFDRFRPGEYLTNAEAVSTLNRVINKYKVKTEQTADIHWAQKGISAYAGSFTEGERRFRIMKEVTASTVLDKPIQVKHWHELLINTLSFDESKFSQQFIENYTIGLADKECIRRDKAVAGLVKLLHLSNDITGRDALPKEMEKMRGSFSDLSNVFDPSKLAIAFSEGLIKGYGDGSFRPVACLTNAEALVLLSRVNEKYIISSKKDRKM